LRLWQLFVQDLAIQPGPTEDMNVKALLYMALLLALTGCTGGLGVKNEPAAHLIMNRPLAKNPYHAKGKSDQRTNRMLAWIELSKN
jgi:hypothetical protein